jgi:putative tryptophan/tyrosine transport system substrate-binding protein
MKSGRAALLILLAVGVLVTPFATEAQPAGKAYRIGYMATGSSADPNRLAEALRLGLRDLGYVEGKNLASRPGGRSTSTNASPTSPPNSSA